MPGRRFCPDTAPHPQKVTIAVFRGNACNFAEPARCDVFVSSRCSSGDGACSAPATALPAPLASRNPLISKTKP
ncbi:hypothetical protein CBM2637_A210029 [Cupriavidus taiwanensis]|nr:hypothetical protein CBM2637_A210029 [Cupriavidus taiwanensis]